MSTITLNLCSELYAALELRAIAASIADTLLADAGADVIELDAAIEAQQ